MISKERKCLFAGEYYCPEHPKDNAPRCYHYCTFYHSEITHQRLEKELPK